MLHAGAVAQQQEPPPPPQPLPPHEQLQQQDWRQEARRAERAARAAPSALALAHAQLAALGDPGESVAPPREYVWAPGRIEVVGKHTDYAKGQSVVCAVDRGIALVFRPGAGARLRVASAGAPTLEFDLSDRARLSASVARSAEGAHWGKYVASVVNYLGLHLGLALPALDVGVGSSLPQNAGLSSSSAVVCGLAALLSRSSRQLSVDELGMIESNNLVGTRGGSQDHAAIMGSRQGLLSLWDYRDGTLLVKRMAMPEDLCFAVAVSGVSACKTGNALERYNALATASAALKEERARKETSAAVRLFCQGVEENSRAKMAEAIALSQRHAETELGTCVAQTEFLPRAALELGAIGSTTFGAGFGGSVYALVPAADAHVFVQRWREAYAARFPAEACLATFFITRPSMGATFVSLSEAW